MSTYPRDTSAGPMWACCESDVGPTCAHREAPDPRRCPMCGRGRYVPAHTLHVATDAELVCDYCGHETYRAPRAYRLTRVIR